MKYKLIKVNEKITHYSANYKYLCSGGDKHGVLYPDGIFYQYKYNNRTRDKSKVTCQRCLKRLYYKQEIKKFGCW